MNLRQIALRILDEYEAGDKFINLALSSHITDKLSFEEKASLTALLYTTVERKLTYDYYICALSHRSDSDIDPHTKNILRLGLCQILEMKSIPDYAAVNETVNLCSGKGEKTFVNGVLRAAVRQKENLPMPDEAKNYRRFLSVKYSFPLGIVKHFDSLYGREKTEKLLKFFNEEKYTDITVNTLRISVDDYKDLLKEKGISVLQNSYAPLSLRIPSSINPEKLPGFDLGYFFVQDRASAISSRVLSASDEDLIVDVCSAPGGKSFSAAIYSSNNAKISSYDLHESKLSLVAGGVERMGLSSIKVGQRDALNPDGDLVGRVDKVICDVPCSGLGVLGKKPDLRYKDLASLTELPALQYDILTSSAAYLKAGGILIYSTCTLNPLENEDVVRRFVLDHPEFTLVPFSVEDLSCEDGMLTLTPMENETDGFFVAKLQRTE